MKDRNPVAQRAAGGKWQASSIKYRASKHTRALLTLLALSLAGCQGYSSKSLYPTDVQTVYVEMFENTTFRRSMEYTLTDALAKRIEAETPYKIVSSRDRADTVITGRIVNARTAALSTERNIGRVLEMDIELTAVVNWKNLRTGDLIIDNRTVAAAASFSQWQRQGETYGAGLAANNLAVRIVELMRTQW